jgi:hypothetical protein
VKPDPQGASLPGLAVGIRHGMAHVAAGTLR